MRVRLLTVRCALAPATCAARRRANREKTCPSSLAALAGEMVELVPTRTLKALGVEDGAHLYLVSKAAGHAEHREGGRGGAHSGAVNLPAHKH